MINGVISDADTDYVGAASEGEAVAIAAGAWLAGREPVVICQNSGLGNAVNPLTSLNGSFEVPILVITTWRGEPGGPADEPRPDQKSSRLQRWYGPAERQGQKRESGCRHREPEDDRV